MQVLLSSDALASLRYADCRAGKIRNPIVSCAYHVPNLLSRRRKKHEPLALKILTKYVKMYKNNVKV